jgi:GTP 3',8-cyclase
VGELGMSLIDRFGRVHRDLRVSLTDRCSLRCTYCMPAEGLPWLPGDQMLSTPELLRLIRIATELGIEQVRLTGGEPLLRPDVVDVVAAVGALPQRPEVSLTTNGIRLPALAARLADAGLDRVNISLDTLQRERFNAMTRRDRLVDVLAGIAAAKAAGLEPVKINTVLMRGVNDDEAVSLLTWAIGEGLWLRFIEQMPLDAQHSWDRRDMLTADEILEQLASRFTLTPVARDHAPAEEWIVDDGPYTVGVIASVTRPFCGSCDRVRLTADGQMRACLFSREESDLRTAMRAGADDASLAAMMTACILGKQAGHGIDEPGFLQPERPMSAIGG